MWDGQKEVELLATRLEKGDSTITRIDSREQDTGRADHCVPEAIEG